MSQGQVPDLDYEEPENAKERDARIRRAARHYYSEYGRSSLFKAAIPDQAMSIEDIEAKRQRFEPDMRPYGVQNKDELLFDNSGYPLGTGDMNPDLFDKLSGMAQEGGFKSLDLESLEQFAGIGEMFKKK